MSKIIDLQAWWSGQHSWSPARIMYVGSSSYGLTTHERGWGGQVLCVLGGCWRWRPLLPATQLWIRRSRRWMMEMIQITPQSVLTWKHHEAVSTLSSMWCHLEWGHIWISILVVLLNTLADRQHLGSSAITSLRRRFWLFLHFKSFLYQEEGWNHSAGRSAVEFSLLKCCPPVSHPPPGANNEMTVAAITNVP